MFHTGSEEETGGGAGRWRREAGLIRVIDQVRGFDVFNVNLHQQVFHVEIRAAEQTSADKGSGEENTD